MCCFHMVQDEFENPFYSEENVLPKLYFVLLFERFKALSVYVTVALRIGIFNMWGLHLLYSESWLFMY